MSDDISISVYLTALKRINAQNADLLARIAELEAAIEPFRRVKGITSVYEYVPIEALRNDEEFNFRMNGAEMKKIYAALNVKS